MERFAPALRRVARELDLPRRTRSTLLLEMAADLEAVFEHHRSRGLSEAEAARRAEETVLASSEVIRRLGLLHESSWRGWAEDVGARLAGGLDLLLLVTGVLPVVALAGGVSVWALAADPAPAVWAILLIGVLMTAVVATETVGLLRGRPFRRHGLPTLLVLTALAPALGLLALVLGVHRAARDLPSASASAAAAAPAVASAPGVQAELAAVMVRDGAALLVGLLLGIGGLLAWFALLHREAQRADREVDALLGGDGHAAAASPPHDRTTVTFPLVRRRHG